MPNAVNFFTNYGECDNGNAESLVMVIFGASGDLTKRKLMPALYLLYKNKRTPESFAVLGIGRTSYTDETYREFMRSQLPNFIKPEELDEQVLEDFIHLLYYESMDPAVEAAYPQLQLRLRQLDEKDRKPGELFVLSGNSSFTLRSNTQVFKKVGLNKSEDAKGFKRIIVEKPFGYDSESAHKLNEIYRSAFHEEQIYRIDHFLGKETVQNILALRFANTVSSLYGIVIT